MNIYSKLLSHCMTWENKFASQFFLTSVKQFYFKSQWFEFQNNLQTGSRALMFFKTLAVNQVRKKLEIIQGSVRRMVIFSCTGLWDFDILLLEKLKLTPWFFWNKMEKENKQTKPTKQRKHPSDVYIKSGTGFCSRAKVCMSGAWQNPSRDYSDEFSILELFLQPSWQVMIRSQKTSPLLWN